MQVIERKIGTKLVRHVTGEDGEVCEVRVEESECSVSDDLAARLTRVALSLDLKMNCALDIEFAVTRGDEIKILQARPITTCFTWSDWELEHEFDTALASDTEILTRGNVGEVFNGSLSPLTQSTVVKCLDLAICQLSVPKTSDSSYISHTTSWLALSHHQVFLRFLDCLLKFPDSQLSVANKGIDFAVFGHQVTTEEMLSQ